MSDKDKKKYFWTVIVFAGSAGIWLPIVVILLTEKEFKWSDMPPNLVTYFLSIIVAGSADYGIKLFDENTNKRTSEYLNINIFLFVSIILVLVSVLAHTFNHILIAFIASFIGVFISLFVWWKANINTSINPNASLGGTVQN